jgi:hypothetical protein
VAQQEAQANHDRPNQKRNASTTGQNTTSDDGTVVAKTIKSVQFKEEETRAGGVSCMFGATRRKKRNIGSVVSSLRRIGKAILIGKPNNYLLRA